VCHVDHSELNNGHILEELNAGPIRQVGRFGFPEQTNVNPVVILWELPFQVYCPIASLFACGLVANSFTGTFW
jgi:hypothetical protein